MDEKSQLESNLKELRSKISELESAIELRSLEVKDLEDRHEVKAAEVEERVRAFDELRFENERLNSSLAEAFAKIEQLDELVNDQTEDLQRRETELETQLSEAKELLQEAKHSVKVSFNSSTCSF